MTQPIEMPYEKLRILIADDVQETRRATRMMLAINPDVKSCGDRPEWGKSCRTG